MCYPDENGVPTYPCWELDPESLDDDLDGEALEEHIAKLLTLAEDDDNQN